MPKYSILIPTYNREHLLPFAIKSVLNQYFDDFELVISNGGSTDNTREVVASFNDKRIKYLESNKRLTAGENYQNALDNATGEFITFLSDDDAFVPQMLSKINEVTSKGEGEIFGFRNCKFFHDSHDDRGNACVPGTLQIPLFNGRQKSFDKNEAISESLIRLGLKDGKNHEKFIPPYLSNAVYDKEVFARVQRKRVKVFDFVPPDMYLTLAVFFAIEKYVCVDIPMLVWSHWAGNMTASAERHTVNVLDHYRKLLGDRMAFETLPFKCITPSNLYSYASSIALLDFDGNLDRIELKSYFVTIYRELVSLRNVGVDVTTELNEFKRALSQQSPNLEFAVEKNLNQPRVRIKAFLDSKLPLVAKNLRKLIGSRNMRVQNIVASNGKGFENIIEAAAKVF